MPETIAGVAVPDSALATAATELVRSTTPLLIYHHSRRVFLFGSLQAQRAGLAPDPELLYVAALFHDLGLVQPYRGDEQRFELDGADLARTFLSEHGFSADDGDLVWTAIALHTTPEVPWRMNAVVAATTAGVETDVLGLRLNLISDEDRRAVVTAPQTGLQAPDPGRVRRRLPPPAEQHLRHRQRRRPRALRPGLPPHRLRRRDRGFGVAGMMMPGLGR